MPVRIVLIIFTTRLSDDSRIPYIFLLYYLFHFNTSNVQAAEQHINKG